MLKAIIFDLNGVFIKSRKLSERFQERFGVPEEKFVVALRDVMPKIRTHDAGDSFVYWKPYFDEWGVQLSRQEFFDFWFHGEREVPEMVALARELKAKGYQLFVLSNNFSERTAYYQKKFPFLNELFEKIYYSWQTGFIKPNPEAFRLLLEENGLRPEECVYFDDLQHNADAASGLGIRSFLFKGVEEARKVL